jgi:hypothetical protein
VRTSLAFTARVYGIMDYVVYLSGCVGPEIDSAVSLMVPIAVLGRRPEIGERLPVTVTVGAIDAYLEKQKVERTP